MAELTPEEKKARNREYQRRYKAKAGVKEKYSQLNKEWIERNRERYYQAKKEYRHKRKIEALHYYSNGSMACAHCGYDKDLDALCLDHINDDGADHRRSMNNDRMRRGGTTIYERLHAKGWIEGLQVLCFNCNTIKQLRLSRGGMTAEQMTEAVMNPQGWHKRPVRVVTSE